MLVPALVLVRTWDCVESGRLTHRKCRSRRRQARSVSRTFVGFSGHGSRASCGRAARVGDNLAADRFTAAGADGQNRESAKTFGLESRKTDAAATVGQTDAERKDATGGIPPLRFSIRDAACHRYRGVGRS